MIGLSIGWRLAQAGAAVTVFERGATGKGASHAAAGMLAAGVEAEPGEEALWPLNRQSQALWPGFARELTALTGIDVGYRDEGTLVVALNRDDVERLRFTADHQRNLGVELEWLAASELRRLEPALAPSVAGAVFSRGDHQVDNRLVAQALRAAFLAAGGTLREQVAVEAVEVSGGRARGVCTADGLHRADVVVLAAGVWSGSIAGLPDGARPQIRPIKGQMLALRMPPDDPLLRHVLWTTSIYLVPRHDGRLIVGGTVEERGFDAQLTAGGVFSLLEGAWRVLPSIEDLPIDEMWVGFRPGSRDDAPVLGPCDIDGLILATGHHRNGILLTPLTAEAIARCVLDGIAPEAIRPFSIERFAQRAKVSA